jgi:hypothetical protein
MGTTVDLKRQFDQSVEQDIDHRLNAHKAKVARVKVGRTAMAANLAAIPEPLYMLSVGDSWFDYPLVGNGPLPGQTDIIAQLESMGAQNPLIANVAHWGYATTDELSLPKQERMVQTLQDKDNWSDSGKPDAILISGGGNDIAGDNFCIYLDFNDGHSTGLNLARFAGVIDSIKASYLDLFSFRDQYAPNVPIFGHCYDFPTPNGVHPICTGPWLQPSLAYRGWTNVPAGANIIKSALQQFRTLLTGFASTPAYNFHLVPTQGTLKPGDWANELHPTPDGFSAMAKLFVTALAAKFPGRI